MPRMSGRERRGVPPLRLIDLMPVAADVVDGGVRTTYEDALNGPESGGWKKVIAAAVKSLDDKKV